jgi:hypothetical protein
MDFPVVESGSIFIQVSPKDVLSTYCTTEGQMWSALLGVEVTRGLWLNANYFLAKNVHAAPFWPERRRVKSHRCCRNRAHKYIPKRNRRVKVAAAAVNNNQKPHLLISGWLRQGLFSPPASPLSAYFASTNGLSYKSCVLDCVCASVRPAAHCSLKYRTWKGRAYTFYLEANEKETHFCYMVAQLLSLERGFWFIQFPAHANWVYSHFSYIECAGIREIPFWAGGIFSESEAHLHYLKRCAFCVRFFACFRVRKCSSKYIFTVIEYCT